MLVKACRLRDQMSSEGALLTLRRAVGRWAYVFEGLEDMLKMTDCEVYTGISV